MINCFNYIITKEESGQTVGEFLKTKEYSRQVIIHIKKTENGIRKNGEWAYVKTVLSENDKLSILLQEDNASENIVPVKMDLDIIFEDEHLLVLNKASNTPIHLSQGNYYNTVANGLAYYFKEKNQAFVFRCINRLDRDTTGLFIVAKHMLSGCILSGMVKDRQIHREYLAIAKGIVPESGTIHVPISRMPGSIIERFADPDGNEDAITHFKCLYHNNKYSLVNLKLETGRTHQIRVHMKYLGYPLIGDYLYNPDFEMINRQALHSHRLEFYHPITKEYMSFTSELPKDMNFLS